ncbi:hypothetical protein CMI37_06425 [Candidatus Pacearchaeota archaeon]|jgi:hypothetical protein|nr:hypothetical protein [Candidatus Pacearchaeota archaeon]|tara:strand:+ start:2579 stop:3277 length:699 start_codon:yes stop_codon:yes gene_type:complete
MNQITFQNVTDDSTSADFNIGQRGMTPDGREWVYVKAASEAFVAGMVAVPDAVVAVDTVSSSDDALGRTVFITKASAGWTVGQFAEAWVYVDAGTGVGQYGKIKTNTSDTLELYPEFAFGTDLSVSDSDITIREPFSVEKAAVSSTIQGAVGIAQSAIANGSYGWVLTRGVGRVLAGESLIVGSNFTTGDNTEGSVIKGVTGEGPFDGQNLGYCLVANASVDTEALVWVDIS